MRYRPELDVIRGICMAAVFLYHSYFFEFGWTGVQAFFVLSGYLITDVLLRDKQLSTSTSRYFINFYIRRALRIFPVYFAYLLLAYFIGRITRAGWIGSLVSTNIEQSAAYLVSYTFNFRLIQVPGQSRFLEHLWSLSIEEQFYWVWPLIVFVLPRKRILNACIVLVLLGPAVRLLELIAYPALSVKSTAELLIYLSPLSHFDAFALGALLNFASESVLVERLVQRASRIVPPLFLLVSACMLLAGKLKGYSTAGSSLGWPARLPYFYASTWGYTLLNFLFFVLIANVSSWKSLIESTILRGLGKISYGFYIFHLPILTLAFVLVNPAVSAIALKAELGAIAFVLTWVVSEISFKYLETPFLNMKKFFTTKRSEIVSEHLLS